MIENGWHGLIVKGSKRGTCNLGIIEGGDATNVVTDRCHIKGEARSFDDAFRNRIVKEVGAAFQRAAKARNVPLSVVRDSADGGRQAYEARLVLVRPDQFIAWCGDEAGNADAVLAKAVGG